MVGHLLLALRPSAPFCALLYCFPFGLSLANMGSFTAGLWALFYCCSGGKIADRWNAPSGNDCHIPLTAKKRKRDYRLAFVG